MAKGRTFKDGLPIGWTPKEATVDTPLNTRQKLYVRFRAEGFERMAAVVAAGYNHKTPAAFAWELEQKPHIQKALTIAREQFAKDNLMTKKKVMDGFLDAIAQAKTLADPTAQIQGWNSIAKLCGYFEPTKHKIEVSVGGRIVLEKLQTLNDDDLVRLAEGDGSVIDAEFVALPEAIATHDE